MPDPATALAAYEAGDVDGIEAVPGPEIPRLSSESDNGFIVVPALGTTYAFFNPAQKPLDDVRVRKALSEAIDRQNIIDFVLQSADQPAMGLVPPGINVAGEDFRRRHLELRPGADRRGRRRQEAARRRRLSGRQGFP